MLRISLTNRKNLVTLKMYEKQIILTTHLVTICKKLCRKTKFNIINKINDHQVTSYLLYKFKI